MTAVAGWRIEAPGGRTVLAVNGGTRYNALRAAFDPAFGLPIGVAHRLDNMDKRTAGWAPIAAAGWRVVPLRAGEYVPSHVPRRRS